VLLGTALLWFGWFGFNAGSTMNATEYAATAFLSTNTAAAAGMITWLVLDKAHKGYVSAIGACFGVVSALVGITSMAGFVSPLSSLLVGVLTALCSYFAMQASRRNTLVDDTLDVFACHGIGGLVGILLESLLSDERVNPMSSGGALHGNVDALWQSLVVIVGVAVFVGVMTWVLYKVVDRWVPMRVTRRQERRGLDRSLHHETTLRPLVMDQWLFDSDSQDDCANDTRGAVSVTAAEMVT
jgi:Amt family ammonium transporter